MPPAPVDSSSVIVLTSRSPARRTSEARERLGGQHHGRHAALHVARAAAVEHPVAHDRRVRVVRPALLRLARDDVDVAVEQQAATAAGAGEAREQLRPAVEVELERHLAPAHVLGRAAPRVDRRAGGRQPLGEMRLQRGLVARRVARVARRRVEADQRGGQLDELVAALGDRLDDALLEVVHRLAFKRRRVTPAPARARGTPRRCPAGRSAPRATAARRRGAAAARQRPRAPRASSHSDCGVSSVVRRPSPSPAARTAPKSTSTRDVLRPRRRERIAAGHAAEVGAQARDRALVAARRPPRRSRARSARRARARAPASRCSSACAGATSYSAPARGVDAGGEQGIAEAPAGGPGTKRKRRSGADVRRAARPASAGGGRGRRRAPRWRRSRRARRRARASSTARAPGRGPAPARACPRRARTARGRAAGRRARRRGAPPACRRPARPRRA